MSGQDKEGAANAPPARRPITENERAWIEFLRLISNDTDPPVTLRRVQMLRRALRSGTNAARGLPQQVIVERINRGRC